VASKEKLLSTILGSEQVPAHQARAVIEEKLRSAIFDGRLPCGMAIRQQELADLFGVSRMPVREALRQLEAQGLIVVEHHRGAVVAPLIQGDATETYDLRLLLEAEALRQSIPLLDDADFARAEACIEALEVATDFGEMGRLNRKFHMALYAKTQNRRLLQLVEEGLHEEERFLRFNLESMGLGQLSQDDHRQLLAAARAHDVVLTVELLTRHLQRGIDAITHYLKSTEG
jgi:DNA-binding GntR family transcriptional regulator